MQVVSFDALNWQPLKQKLPMYKTVPTFENILAYVLNGIKIMQASFSACMVLRVQPSW
jgi:hypothetical protein